MGDDTATSDRSGLFLALAAIAAVFGLCALLLLNHKPSSASPSTFQQIEVGMSRAAVHQIFGDPDFEAIYMGRAIGPSQFATNAAPSAKSVASGRYSQHLFEQWNHSEITAMVIFDWSDRVVCRYSLGEQTQTIFGRLWPRRTVAWPPKTSGE